MFMVFATKDSEILDLKTCEFFDEAQEVADAMVMDVQGVSNDMPNWYESTTYTDEATGIKIEISDLNSYKP